MMCFIVDLDVLTHKDQAPIRTLSDLLQLSILSTKKMAWKRLEWGGGQYFAPTPIFKG